MKAQKKKKKNRKKTRLLTFKPAKGFQVAAGWRNCWWSLFFFLFFFFFFNTAALIQITWTTGVVCESPVFLRSVYCSHLVCGCVIESGPCLNKRQMWTQISCLLLYVIDGNASSCRSAAVRPPPPLWRWCCLNCCAPCVIKTIFTSSITGLKPFIWPSTILSIYLFCDVTVATKYFYV